MIYVYFLLFYTIALYIVLRFRYKKDFFDNIMLFLTSNIIIYFVTSIQIVIYPTILTLQTFLYYFISTNLFIIGYLAASIFIKEKNNSKIRNFEFFNLILSLNAIVYVSIAFYQIMTEGFSFDTSLSELRNEFLGEVNQVKSLGLINIIKGLSRSFAIVFSSLIVIYKYQKRTVYLIFSVITFLSLLIETTIQGGRTTILYCIILMALNISYLKIKEIGINPILSSKKRVIKFVIIGFFAVIVVFGVFPALRNPYLLDGVNTYINWHHSGARVNPTIEKIVDKNSNYNLLLGLAFGSTYISSPLVKYNYYITEMKISDWYAMGAYNFPILEKVFTLSNERHYFFREKIDIYSQLDKNEGNPWATAYRDFVIDFGLIGSLIMSFISGFILTKLSNVYKRNRANSFDLSVSSLSSFSCMLIPFYSPFVVIGQILFLMGLFMIFYKIIKIKIIFSNTKL